MTAPVAVDYVVLPTGCPITDTERHNFELHVVLRGADPDGMCWAVIKQQHRRLSRVTGKWDGESIPSERRDTYIKEHSFFLKDALDLAQTVVDEYDENGQNYSTWASFRDGQTPYRNDATKRNYARSGDY